MLMDTRVSSEGMQLNGTTMPVSDTRILHRPLNFTDQGLVQPSINAASLPHGRHIVEIGTRKTALSCLCRRPWLYGASASPGLSRLRQSSIQTLSHRKAGDTSASAVWLEELAQKVLDTKTFTPFQPASRPQAPLLETHFTANETPACCEGCHLFDVRLRSTCRQNFRDRSYPSLGHATSSRCWHLFGARMNTCNCQVLQLRGVGPNCLSPRRKVT